MLLFVPLTDEMLYAQDGPPAPLVPYRCGLNCTRALRDVREVKHRAEDDAGRTVQPLSDSLRERRPARR
jgi:hypothetical protein